MEERVLDGPTALGPKIADGRTAEVFRLGDDVVKLLRPSIPPSWADREGEFASAVGHAGLPVPAVRGLVTVGDRRGLVVEYVEGPSMWDRIVDDPASATTLILELVALQREVHEASLPDGLPSLVERLHAKIADVDEFDDADRRRADELLARVPRGAAVLHGDLHPGNVLLAASGPVIIDWFDTTVGHPRADVERTSMLLEPVDATDLAHLPGASPDLLSAVAATYRDAMGVGDDPEEWAWRALVAASRLSERTDDPRERLRRRWLDHCDVAVAQPAIS